MNNEQAEVIHLSHVLMRLFDIFLYDRNELHTTVELREAADKADAALVELNDLLTKTYGDK